MEWRHLRSRFLSAVVSSSCAGLSACQVSSPVSYTWLQLKVSQLVFHKMFFIIQLSLISPPDQMISKPGVTTMAVCWPRDLPLLLRGVPYLAHLNTARPARASAHGRPLLALPRPPHPALWRLLAPPPAPSSPRPDRAGLVPWPLLAPSGEGLRRGRLCSRRSPSPHP